MTNAEPTLDPSVTTPLAATVSLISCRLEKKTAGPPSFST
ncbi:hypothetical protein M2436_005875 [Streptomyces sp. HB372]|nr:hypothetical protein [Streptomyces sp. HB372]